MESTYSGRKELRQGGRDRFAEVSVRISPSETPTRAGVSADALADLREAVGEDAEALGRELQAAVAAQIHCANVDGRMPHVGATAFLAEVLRVHVTDGLDRTLSGYLIVDAGRNAVYQYLCDWERARARGGWDGVPG